MIAVEYDVTTPVEGFTGEVAGVAFKDGQGRTSVPGAVQYFRRHGYTVVPVGEDQRGDAGGEGSGSGPEAGERPARSANKAAWVAYAVTCGADEAEAEATTKDDLIQAYGGDG